MSIATFYNSQSEYSFRTFRIAFLFWTVQDKSIASGWLQYWTPSTRTSKQEFLYFANQWQTVIMPNDSINLSLTMWQNRMHRNAGCSRTMTTVMPLRFCFCGASHYIMCYIMCMLLPLSLEQSKYEYVISSHKVWWITCGTLMIIFPID